MSIKTSAFVACLIGIIYVLLCSQVDSKPLVRLNAKKILNSQYDLLALPSGENRQVATYEPRPQYVAQESPDHHQQQNQERQEVYYVQAEQNSMEHADPNNHYHHPDCSHDMSHGAQPNGADEQPEEILYTDDNGNLFKRVGDHYEPASATTSLVPVSEQTEDASANPSKNSDNHNPVGMTATILTEVPLRDLPDHVLEQLKMDYGAKVVATRDYPGANLVINCGDSSSHEMSICSKHRQTSNSNYLSYPLLTSTLDEHAEHDSEAQPEIEHVNEAPQKPEKSEHTPEPEPTPETYETTENPEGSYGYRGAPSGQEEQPEASASSSKLTSTKNDEESNSNPKETESDSAEKTQQDDGKK